jgi:hypothetical protein
MMKESFRSRPVVKETLGHMALLRTKRNRLQKTREEKNSYTLFSDYAGDLSVF